jgi:hypothetical protein
LLRAKKGCGQFCRSFLPPPQANDVQVVGLEVYRDYPRLVLRRNTSDGEQRLFLDKKTGFPVKLDLQEPHYLWGQRHIEYLYSNWVQQGDININGASFCLADGDVDLSETIGSVELLAPSHTASLLQMLPRPQVRFQLRPAF